MRSPAERRRPGIERILAAVMSAVLLAAPAACSGDGDDTTGSPVVEVFGPVVGDAGEALAEQLREVSSGTGVELRYIGVTSFDAQLVDRLERGDRPGVVLLPQPGGLDDLIERGVAQPLPDSARAEVTASLPSALTDLVSRDGAPVAVPLTVDVKSLVWYRPHALAQLTPNVPETLDELDAIVESVLTDGGVAPWCLATEAGSSTGWVGTDWVEDLVLRRLGPDDYARWTRGELRFDSPEIASVFDELDRLVRRPGAVAGGSRAVLTTPWESAADQILSADRSPCLFVHQADFLRRHFPADTTIGDDLRDDVNFFPLPGVEKGTAPLVIGGMLAIPLLDSPEVDTAMDLLAGRELGSGLMATGDFLSPRADAAESSDATTQRLVELLQNADVIVFDGADLMPPSVGTGTFWEGMNSFFAGEDIESVLKAIDAGWPDGDGAPTSD